MLETFRQLGIQASSTLSRIFDALNAYLGDARSKSTFGKEMSVLGAGLGLCHHALRHFGIKFLDRVCFVSITPLSSQHH